MPKSGNAHGRTSAASKKPSPDFEAELLALEATVRRLEDESISLEDSLALFEDGVKRSRLCAQALDEAELRVKRLTEDANGTFELQPLTSTD